MTLPHTPNVLQKQTEPLRIGPRSPKAIAPCWQWHRSRMWVGQTRFAPPNLQFPMSSSSSHLQNLIREPESHIATPPKMESKATEMHHSPTSPPDRLNHSKSASASAVMRLKAKDDAAVRYDPLPARPPAPTSFSEPGPMCSSAMGLWGGAAAAGGAAGGGAGGLGGLRPRAELRYCRSCWRCAARMW